MNSPNVLGVDSSAADQTTVVTRRQRFSTAGIVSAISGAVILIMGLVALARADLDSSFSEPIFQVAGFDHNQTLAFLEILLGGMLLIAGMTDSVSGMRVLGAITVIGSFVALVEPGILGGDLELEGAYVVILLLLGAASLIAAAVLPTIERNSRSVSTHHEADSTQQTA